MVLAPFAGGGGYGAFRCPARARTRRDDQNAVAMVLLALLALVTAATSATAEADAVAAATINADRSPDCTETCRPIEMN